MGEEVEEVEEEEEKEMMMKKRENHWWDDYSTCCLIRRKCKLQLLFHSEMEGMRRYKQSFLLVICLCPCR